MEQIDSKVDLFQSLKDEESSEHEEISLKSVSETDDIKYEARSDDDNIYENHVTEGEAGTSFDKGNKKKLDKQNRKEIEEEEREKML